MSNVRPIDMVFLDEARKDIAFAAFFKRSTIQPLSERSTLFGSIAKRYGDVLVRPTRWRMRTVVFLH